MSGERLRGPQSRAVHSSRRAALGCRVYYGYLTVEHASEGEPT